MASSFPIRDNPIIAQYFAKRISWRGSQQCLLVLRSCSISTYDPATSHELDRWRMEDIDYLLPHRKPEQIILSIRKSHLLRYKMRFQCHARSHLIAQFIRTQKNYSFVGHPFRIKQSSTESTRYVCTELLRTNYTKKGFLQLMDTAIEYLDERGWLVAKFPLIHLQAIGPSSCHPNAIAIQLFFNRRLFLCSPRSEFLMRVSSRVRTLGVSLEIESSALTVHDLEQFHAHAIKGESYGIFEVCTLDNSSQTSIRKKLILQRQAIIEVESSMDIVTYWPLNKLQTVVRPFWDDKMIVLGFAEEKNTVFHILHRDKFISTLFLLCHEGNFPNVTLQLETIERNRLYQPHFSVRKASYANSAIEAMCLRKIVLAGNFLLVQSEYQGFPFIPSRNFESQQKNLSLGNAQTHMSESKPRSSDFSFEKHQLKVNTTAIKTRSIFDMDEAVTSSGFLIVLQEFNVNIPAQGLGEIIDRDLVAKSIQIVLAYLCFEVEANQYFQDHCFPFLHISMALQALMRLLSSPLGALDEKMIIPFLGTVSEILNRSCIVSSYYCLRCLQKLISSKPAGFDYCKRQRELLYLLEEDELIERLIGLLPTDSYPSGLLSPPMKFESPLNQESKGSCQTLSSSTEEPDDEDQHGTNVSVLAHETVTIFYLLINKLRSKNDSKSGKRSVAMVSNSFMMTDLSIQTHWLIKQLLDNRMALIEVASSSQCRIAAKPVISLFQFLLHHVRMHIDDFIEESHEDFTQRLESLPSLSSPFSSLPLTQELTPKELLGQKLEDIEDFLTDYFEQYRTIVQDHCTSKSNSLEWYDDMSKYQSSHPQTLDQTIDFSKRIPVKVEYADICDACMECNDMCGHPDCFLCTQKEYHVQNSILPTSRTENNSRDQGVTTVSSRHCFSASALESVTGARTQRIPHNQSDERRNFKDYSSCEVERMQRNGSKILIVDSAVYDVTLLFEFYPHPVKSLQRLRSDDKRHFLGDYLIGNYYACETPITLKQW